MVAVFNIRQGKRTIEMGILRLRPIEVVSKVQQIRHFVARSVSLIEREIGG